MTTINTKPMQWTDVVGQWARRLAAATDASRAGLGEKLSAMAVVISAVFSLHIGLLHAQTVPPPQNIPFPGTLTVDVDLTDLDRKVMPVRQTLPVQPGPLTLLYPQWIPGTHSATGSVGKMAGLQITAHGKPVAWTRDTVDVFAFHLTVPPGATVLDIAFQHLSPVSSASGRVVMTQEIIGLQWNTVVLYPAGYFVSGIQARASAKLPPGWQTATSLDIARRTGDRLEFKPVSLETLVDSPLWAGKYSKRIELDVPGTAVSAVTPAVSSPAASVKPPVYLTVFADTASQLEAAPEHIEAHRQLVTQADAVFGSRHFARYEFLLAISEFFSGIGLEHSESSENGVRLGYFTEWKKSSAGRTLLPHEYAHSWNGKFRRPADLWTPNYNVPMRDSLLWIYEGQTQYWGYVLAARSGIVPLADSLDGLAQTAAALDARSGRAWRNLQDTTNEPVISGRGGQDWSDWQRRAEYYDEGLLIWLDVDTKIRELTQEAKSLADVSKAFFGIADGRVAAITYTFDDYVNALSSVAPSTDWAAFLRQRLDTHTNTTLLDGIKRGGWRQVFSETQGEYSKSVEGAFRFTDFGHSLGFNLDRDAKLASIRWEGPAFKAGLTGGMQLIAVNSVAYKAEDLRAAITAAKDGRGIELLVKTDNRYKTVKIDYRGGLRYPKLERIEGTPDRLTALLSAVK
jgi:predicted metalloprotease with PDZ domain